MREEAHDKRRRKGADEGFDPEEKPFLDHLEDLRKMFFKIIFALLLAMIVCLVFNQHLLNLIRLPMQWANIGGGGPLFIVTEEKTQEDDRIKPGDVILTQSGILGTVAAVDEEKNITRVEIGSGDGVVEIDMLSSSITSKMRPKLDEEGNPVESDDRTDYIQTDFLIMEVFTPYEALVLVIKIAFFAGIVLSFPFIGLFIAQFVLPGLRQAEKKVVFPALGVGFFLFLVGATFAFTVGLPYALNFLAEFTIERGIKPGWRIGYYVKFVTQVTLVFGIFFELPVVVMSLVKLDLLTFRSMRDSRSYAIVILLCLSAIFTPPDPMTLGLLAGPLIILYEMCIWMAWFLERKKLKAEAAEERRRAERRADLAELPPADEMSEEEKREASASDIARYEADQADIDSDHLEHDHDPYHDEHGHYHDPYHDDPHHHHGHGGAAGGMIDINHASLEELQQLPGVGPKLAERIIESRPFYSEDELEYHAHLPQSVIKLILDRVYFG